MPTFKLDGREIPFEAGDTIIQAAHRAGIDIPHYCWHPGLSVAANCRMCLVEVGPPPGRPAMMLNVLSYDEGKGEYVDQQKPKLQPACQMNVAEGMDVKSESSEHVSRARSAVQELLLLNHPVDCPICDQAGECRLQDYWLEHQADHKRMRDEPVHKPKAVVFGPTIVYDAERCIVCTRCVRFCEEVAKDPVLDMRERGNLNEIVVSPGRELDHAYTLMTEYVCPVGALTAQDFRFKARVWFLRSSRSVCQGCATGCNAYLDYDPRDQTVYRHRPRENQEVNKYWMCDEGMLDYRRVHEGRILEASQGKAASGRQSVRVGEALDRAAKELGSVPGDSVAVVYSAQHSNEDNFALQRLSAALGVKHAFVSGKAPGSSDEVLRHADKNPNTGGVQRVLRGQPGDLAALGQAISKGGVSHVLLLGAEAMSEDAAEQLAGAKSVVLVATHSGPLAPAATVTLPATTWAESDGTFTNAKGLTQTSEAAIEPQGDARPGWKLLVALGARMGHDLGWRSFDDVAAALEAAQAGSVHPAPRAGATP